MQEILEGSDILFLTNAAYIQNFDKTPYITVSFIDKDGKPYGLPLSLASDDDVN